MLQYLPDSNLINNQYQMAWLSLPFGVVCFTFLTLSAPLFDTYATSFSILLLTYIALQLTTTVFIKTKPLSPWRIITIIALHCGIIASTLAIAGDPSSGMNLLFVALLFLSAYWFGLAYLFVTLTFVLGCYLLLVAYFGIPDMSTFFTQLITFLFGPVMGVVLSNQSQPAFIMRNKFMSLLNQSPLPIFTYHIENGDPIIRYANTESHRIFSPELSLTDKQVCTLAIREDELEMISSCKRGLLKRKEQKQSFFIRGHNDKNEVLQLMCIADRLLWQGEYIGICFMFDITKSERQRNEMNSSMKEGYMSTLVAGIVHDFRNVLTNIIGSAEVLQLSITDSSVKKQLQRIIQSSEQGSETITHLLELSKGNKGKVKQPQTAFDIQPTVRSIIALLRLQLPDHIELHCEIEPNLPLTLFDAPQLEQVLVNLINNATQAIKETGKISVFVTSDEKHLSQSISSTALRISIVDNGCGIPETDLASVTESFWTSRQNSGGTGLGLAMVKRIVNQQGGKLEISSTVNTGTMVDVYLPEHKGTLQTAPQHKNTLALKNETKPCHILLVDDAAEVLDVHHMLLEAMGHTVFVARSAKEAIAIFAEQPIQLLITDFKMPDMDGSDLAVQLRKKEPKLPILIITAYDKKSKLEHLQKLNISILLKPGTFQKMGEHIAKVQAENQDFFS
ncbi:MAG: ATP-binding protein [Ghiorsea sp.]